MYLKEILIILFCVVTFIMNFYLLYIAKINAFGFSAIAVALSIVALIFYNINQVEKITTNQGDIIEIRKIREELYVKTEVVKRIGEELAAVEAFNVAHLCRFAPDNLTELMIEKRNRLIELLESLGSSKEKISETIKAIDEMVVIDLSQKVLGKIDKNSQKIFEAGVKVDRVAVREKVARMFKNYILNGTSKKEIEIYLKSVDCYSTEISDLLDRYEKFIRDEKK